MVVTSTSKRVILSVLDFNPISFQFILLTSNRGSSSQTSFPSPFDSLSNSATGNRLRHASGPVPRKETPNLDYWRRTLPDWHFRDMNAPLPLPESDFAFLSVHGILPEVHVTNCRNLALEVVTANSNNKNITVNKIYCLKKSSE